MEALRNLVTNVPDWLRKLDELNGQIEQRQLELARLTEETKASSPDGHSGPKSVRNKGSTESLKPRGEPEAHPCDPVPHPDPDTTDDAEARAAAAAAGAAAARANTEQQPAPPSPSDSQTPSALQRQASQMRAAGQARARATLRKRQRTDSIMSAEGAAPKYRTRSMIIVYYDSYVQMFFEELVKFVSAGRNMMRKAKMAAKVAQIKRMAELEMPDDDDDDDDDDTANKTPAAPTPSSDPAPAETSEPALPYVSTRRMGAGYVPRTARTMYLRTGARVGPGGRAGGPDVYDELDKGLEYVQSMCEHAAHQFLRDGDCAEEVANIKRRLAETRELADRELERVRREDPDALAKLAAADDDPAARGRSYRPQSMRRDGAAKPPAHTTTTAAAAAAAVAAAAPLEADQDADGADDEPLPKLVYKSTRMMRSG